MNKQSPWLFEAPLKPGSIEAIPRWQTEDEAEFELEYESDPSSVRRAFESAVRASNWRSAFLNLNGLNMTEMLLALDSLRLAKLNELWNYAPAYARLVNMPRLNYAKTVVVTGRLPKPIRDLQATGQVQDAANFLARRRSKQPKKSKKKPAPVTPGPCKGTPFVTTFHPGVMHDHKPTGRWGNVQLDAWKKCGSVASEILINPKKLTSLPAATASQCACALFEPAQVARIARSTSLVGLPLAQKHFDHYLTGGGKTLTVDLEDVIRRDSKVRNKLKPLVKKHCVGFTKINQSDYAIRDFQFAFGAIDRLDFQVDHASGRVHLWFKDRYEWHPVGFGYSKFPDDGVRDTNCVHAAMVELKSSGASDYWMEGDTVVPLSWLS